MKCQYPTTPKGRYKNTAAEHHSGEQRLPPESHQPEGVQVLRVQGPEPHPPNYSQRRTEAA
jgi:hypothetical protein